MLLFKSHDITVLLMDLQTSFIIRQWELIIIPKKESLTFILRIPKKTLIL